jgi:hypothetical protein
MRTGARGWSIAGGLIGALGLAQVMWGPVLEGRISASGELRTAAIAAVVVGVSALILGRLLHGAQARVVAAFVQWLALPAALLLGLGWYLIMHSGTKGYAYRAAMQAELRDLVLAEQAYRSDSGRYASDTKSLGSSWFASSGVVGPTITLTAGGFQAVVSHISSEATCTVFVGPALLAPAVKAGEPECRPSSRHNPWPGLVALGVGLVLGGVGVARAGRPDGGSAV